MGGLFRLRNVTIVGNFYYLILIVLVEFAQDKSAEECVNR
jgi:hypothetical protein